MCPADKRPPSFSPCPWPTDLVEPGLVRSTSGQGCIAFSKLTGDGVSEVPCVAPDRRNVVLVRRALAAQKITMLSANPRKTPHLYARAEGQEALIGRRRWSVSYRYRTMRRLLACTSPLHKLTLTGLQTRQPRRIGPVIRGIL